MLHIAEQDLGGARVRLTFKRGGQVMKMGDLLSGDEVRAIPNANRRALVEAGYLEPFPKAPVAPGTDRFIVAVGKEKFNVIEGRTINDRPLTSRAEAEALAAQA